MDWLSQNWIWLFIIAAMFLMMRRGGMGCGMAHARTCRQGSACRLEGA